jgi:hypothetical protein
MPRGPLTFGGLRYLEEDAFAHRGQGRLLVLDASFATLDQADFLQCLQVLPDLSRVRAQERGEVACCRRPAPSKRVMYREPGSVRKRAHRARFFEDDVPDRIQFRHCTFALIVVSTGCSVSG